VCLRAPIGVPDARWCPKERPLGYVNRKPGPAPWGLPPPGPASVPPRGRAWASGSPPTAGRRPPRKGSIGIRGAWSSERMAKATDPRGGEGTPRRDPGGPAGRSRPNGRARSGLQDQPRRPRPICGGAARPHRVSHGRPQAQMGRGARGSPRDGPGETGAKPHGLLREASGRRPKGPAGPQAVESPGLRDALIPKGPPLLPPPTGGGFRRYGGPFAKCAFVQG